MKKKIVFVCVLLLFLNFLIAGGYSLNGEKDPLAMQGFFPEVDARSAIAIDVDSGRILYNKFPFQRVSIASTTKIMTAIVALENADYNQIIEVSGKAAWTGGSTIGLKKGEKMPLH